MDALSRIGRKSYVSLNGLEHVLKELKKLDNLPDATSRGSIKRARQGDCKIDTGLGPTFTPLKILVKEVDHKKQTTYVREHSLPHVSLPAVLQHAIATSEGFRQFFLAKLRAYPNGPTSPWRLIVYADEITPGNALKPLNSRKLHTFYMSFVEFDHQLSAGAFWITVLTARSDLVNKMEGGLSELFKCLLEAMFQGPFNLKTGCMLDFGQGQQQHLFFASKCRMTSRRAGHSSMVGSLFSSDCAVFSCTGTIPHETYSYAEMRTCAHLTCLHTNWRLRALPQSTACIAWASIIYEAKGQATSCTLLISKACALQMHQDLSCTGLHNRPTACPDLGVVIRFGDANSRIG